VPLPHAVTVEEAAPPGWVCEGCGTAFRAGDTAYGELTGMIGSVPVESNWLCVSCYYDHAHDRP